MPLTRKADNDLKRALLTRYREAEDQLRAHLANLVRSLDFFPEGEIGHRVGVRLKSYSTIVEKVDRQKPRKVSSLSQLENNVVTDIVGGRVVLDYVYQVRRSARQFGDVRIGR